MNWEKGVIKDRNGKPKKDQHGRVLRSNYFMTSDCGAYQVSKAFIGPDREADVRYQAWRLKNGLSLGVRSSFKGEDGAAALCAADSLK